MYLLKHTVPFIPLPETPLAEEPGYPVPDGLLFEAKTEWTRVIIDVYTNRSFNNDLRKIVWLIEEDDYGIQEGFVYNYKTREWLRYRKGNGGAATASSFQELMGVKTGEMV